MEQFEELIKRQTLVDFSFEVSARDHFLTHFIAKYTGHNLQSRTIEFDIKDDIENIVEKVVNMVEAVDVDAKVNVCFLGTQLVSIQTPYTQIFIRVRDHNYGYPRRDYSKSKTKINCFEFEMYSDPERLQALVPDIATEYKHQSHVRVSWCFLANGCVEHTSLYIEHKLKLYDEFYPWFANGVNAFIKEYLEDDAVILVLHGQPGTGKTSFLKHLLLNNRLNAMISYDEKVLNDDRFFIEFLTSDENNFLIVEDADSLLLPRESDKNHVMSKFLNVSDGLIKVADKKMVFTTNISQLSKLDQALIRKGRCFAATEFRNLKSSEAEIAAKAAGLPEKDWKSRPSWSIADIFDKPIAGLEKQTPVRKIGF